MNEGFEAEKNVLEKNEVFPERKEDAEAEKFIKERINVEALLLGDFRTEYLKDKEVVEALARLVYELKDGILDYDSILSDDASGRITSLILEKVINNAKEKEGEGKIKTFFIAGGRYQSDEIDTSVEKFMSDKKNVLGKTLLVTEYISTGNSIGRMMDKLERQGIDFDVGTVSLRYDPREKHDGSYYEDYNKRLLEKVKYGAIDGDAGLNLYEMSVDRYSGVDKDSGSKSAHPSAHRGNYRESQKIADARHDVEILAEELSKLLD